MQPNQKLIIGGCFKGEITNTAWLISGNGLPQPDPVYYSNAEETDSRIWLHVKNTRYREILVISPDTDVYHIGFPLQSMEKDVIVQINPLNSRQLKFISMRRFLRALTNDPDCLK